MESKNMRILVLDTETTGLNLNTSKICQIAGRIEEIDANGKFSKKGEFAIHCCPSDMTEAAWEAAKKSFEINHLSRELLTGKPDEIAVLNELANIIATYKVDYLVGQNIMEYDLPLMINRLGETSTFSRRRTVDGAP